MFKPTEQRRIPEVFTFTTPLQNEQQRGLVFQAVTEAVLRKQWVLRECEKVSWDQVSRFAKCVSGAIPSGVAVASCAVQQRELANGRWTNWHDLLEERTDCVYEMLEYKMRLYGPGTI